MLKILLEKWFVYRYNKNKQSTWPWIFENLQGLLSRIAHGRRREFIHNYFGMVM